MSDFKIVSLLNPSVVILSGVTGPAIAGGTSSQSNGTITFGSSAGNVTFGLSNGYMTASAPAGGGGGGTNYVFSNSNGVSFGTNISTVTATVATNYMASNQSSNFAGLGTTFAGTNISGSMTHDTNGLNLALSVAAGGGAGDGGNIIAAGGSTAASTGTVVLGNANNVSFGLNLGTVTASASFPAQTVDTNKAGVGYTSTTQGGTTVGVTHNTAGLSMAWPPFITTYVNDLTSGRAGVGFTSATTAGTAIVATQNTAGLSMGVPAYITTYAAQTNQTVASGNIAGVGTTYAGTNINATIGLNSAGLALSLSAAAGGAGDGVNIVQIGTAGTTGTAFSASTGTVFLNGSNNITVSQNNSNQIIISGPTLTQFLTTARASNDAIGLNSALTANGVSVTANSSGLSLNFPAFLTTAAQSNHSHNFATTTTGGSNIVVGTANSAGVTVGVPAFITTFAAQTNQTVASGNIAGTGYTSTTQAGATVGVTHNTAGLSVAWPPYITAAAGGAFGAGASTDAIGTTGTVNGQIVFFEGNTNITLSQSINGNSASLSIFAPAGGAGGSQYSAFLFQPEVYGNTLMSTLSTGTVYFRPFELGGYVDADKYMIQQSLVSLTSTRSLSGGVSGVINTGGTGSWGMTGTMAMYSRVDTNETGASYNSIKSFDSKTFSIGAGYTLSQSQSTNVSSATVSYSSTMGVSYVGQIDGAGGFTTTFASTTGSGSFSSTSTGAGTFGSSRTFGDLNNYISGIRPAWIPAAGSGMPPGEYWMGYQFQTTSGSTGSYSLNAVAQLSLPGMLFYTASSNNYLELGNPTALTTSNWRLGFGSISASSLTTGNIAMSQISTMASNASLYFAIMGQTK